jgi:hypothetical protein
MNANFGLKLEGLFTSPLLYPSQNMLSGRGRNDPNIVCTYE